MDLAHSAAPEQSDEAISAEFGITDRRRLLSHAASLAGLVAGQPPAWAGVYMSGSVSNRIVHEPRLQ
jgi:hypothetical protein